MLSRCKSILEESQMKAIDSRIRRLQQQLCPDEGQPQRIWVTVLAGQEFALDQDRCIEILRECGYLPSSRFVVLHFFGVPNGLNAKELEQYLRKNGAETCGFGGSQKQGGTGGATSPGETGWLNQAQMSGNVLR